MKEVTWFLIGGAAAYLLVCNAKGKLGFSFGAGVDAGRPESVTANTNGDMSGGAYRGNQPEVPYNPLGTVGGFPGAVDYGYGAYIGFGGSGDLGGGAGYASNYDQPGLTNPYGTTNVPAGDCNECYGGAKA